MATARSRARPPPSPRRSLAGLAAWLGVTLAAAAIGGLATSRGLDPFYGQLEKPPWSPPESVFGPVWTVLYVLMAVSAWLVWRAGGRRARLALGLFVAQLALNAAWSVLFFGLERPAAALVDVVVLLVAITATAWAFTTWSRTGAWLLLPYHVWVAFATVLNAAIVRLNP